MIKSQNHAPILEGPPALILLGAVGIIFVIIGVTAFRGLLREIPFYRNANWDFSKDSGIEIFKQKEALKRFSFLPLGVVKLLYYGNGLAMMIIVSGPIVRLIIQRVLVSNWSA